MEPIDRVVAERGVAGLAATACVRIRDAAGDVVGSGFLIGQDLVATCAHIVASAAGADPFAAAPPEAVVAVDFPVLPAGPVAGSARVHRWVPISEDGTGDVALLRLAGPAPPGAVMPPVRRVEELWDHRFRAFGFPAGREDGVWATGRIRAEQGTGWCQLQGTPGDQPIEGGFSGSPVWDDETGAVVGMTVAADRDLAVTTAYLIPVGQVLGLDPELLPCPYRGLAPFGEEHAEYFFGREPDVQRLHAALERCPLVAVAGPSGIGKSSLIRAGLLPGLRASGARIAEVRPRAGAPAHREVAAAVLALADPYSSEARRARDASRIAAALTDPAGRAAALEELTAAIAAADADGAAQVLLVDQFEELAEADPDQARELLGVLAGLTGAAGSGGALRVVLTVRGGALDEILTPDIAEALGSGTVLVGPLDRAQLREAVVRPAEHAPGLVFEDGLVDRILDDAGAEPGQLPLVESLLAQLWERRDGGRLTTAGYQAAGGVTGALAAHAEQVLARLLGGETALDRLRALFIRLAVPGRDGRFVRRPLPYTELPAELRPLVPPLAAGRLVVVAGGPGKAGTVELAHEALAEHWPRLRDWLAADREFLAWRAEMDAARHRWESSGRDDGALLRGAALATARSWAARRPDGLTEETAEFLGRSQARRQREIRRWRSVSALLTVLVLAAGALSVIAVRGGDRIAAQQASANADTLGREAITRAERDPVLAAQLALAGWRSDPASATARTALAGQYLALASTESVVAGRAGGPPIHAISVASDAPDGVVAVTSDTPKPASGTVITGALGRRPQHQELTDPTGMDNGVLSPDGRYYAYLAGDGAIRLWDVTHGSITAELVAPGGSRSLEGSFAPDSTRFGWLTRDATTAQVVTVYDLRTGIRRSTAITLRTSPATLHLSADPDLVLVREGAPGRPDTRLSLRSLVHDTEIRVLPGDTMVAGTGAYTLTCDPIDPAVLDSRPVLHVQDSASGAELRTLPLTGFLCSNYWLSADKRHIVERLAGQQDAQQHAWRVTDLSSGRSYQFMTPPLNETQWPLRYSPAMGMVSSSTGTPTAMVASGPTLLRVRTTLEVPRAQVGAKTLRRFRNADGSVLLAADIDDLATYQPSTGQPLASRTVPVSPGTKWITGDDLWVLGRGPARWQLTRYSLPGLNPVTRFALPADPAAVAGHADVAMGGDPDDPAATVLVLTGGLLGAWDARSGQPISQPIQLASTPAQSDWYRHHAMVWSRDGHPRQALVATPNQHVQLWDVATGRLLRELPIFVSGGARIVASGDRLVACTDEDTLEVWDLSSGRRSSPPLPVPRGASLVGFSTDGYLVADLRAVNQIIFYDLGRRAEAGTLRLVGSEFVGIDGATLSIDGELGRMPSVLVATAQQWHEQLCRIIPDELSAAARELLPSGADPSSPCP